MNTKPKITYKTLVQKAIVCDEFKLAWKLMGELGVGSKEAFDLVKQLMLSSDFHLQRLEESAEVIAKAAAAWADKPRNEKNLKIFLDLLRGTIGGTAVVFTVAVPRG